MIIRICETINFPDPFLLESQLSKRVFWVWEEYFTKKDLGEIISRDEYYSAQILQLLTTYFTNGEISPKLNECLIKFNVDKIKTQEDIEDELRAKEEIQFKKIDSFNKIRKNMSKKKSIKSKH
jgi:hypothetical protein